MRTDVACEKLIEIVPIIEELRPKLKADEKFQDIIKNFKSTGDEKKDNIGIVLKIIPSLLGDYKEYTYKIVAIMSDKTVEDVKAQSFSETINSIKNILSDGDLVRFF